MWTLALMSLCNWMQQECSGYQVKNDCNLSKKESASTTRKTATCTKIVKRGLRAKAKAKAKAKANRRATTLNHKHVWWTQHLQLKKSKVMKRQGERCASYLYKEEYYGCYQEVEVAY
jgi:hypothetical protein